MTIRLLHVDDDPDIRAIVGMALARDPLLEPVATGSGTEALSLVADGLCPDAALLDATLPDMDGTTLRVRLHALMPPDRLPVIYMTARARPHELAALRAPGVLGAIVKPFDPLRLPLDIHALLDQRILTR